MVFAAEMHDPIDDWDDSELLDVRWFNEGDVRRLATEQALPLLPEEVPGLVQAPADRRIGHV